MNAQAILDKIASDAQENALRIQDEAREKAEKALADTRQKLAADEAAMRAQAERDGAELSQRMGRMAELENRKALLKEKRVVIDAAFDRARELFLRLDAGAMRAFFLERVAEDAAGDETLTVGQNASQWFDDRFLADASALLQRQGKQTALQLSPEQRPGVTGFLLQQGGMEINCTLEAMLGDLRMDMETDVARLLFGEA